MSNKSVNTSPSAVLFFLNAIKFFTLKYCQNRYKTQEMCGKKTVSDDLFILKYYHDKCKSQEMCEKIADDFLPALKFVLDCFVTSKTIKKLHTDLFTGDDILFLIKILVMPHLPIKFDVNFNRDDPETIIHVRLMVWRNKFKQRKAFKKEIYKE